MEACRGHLGSLAALRRLASVRSIQLGIAFRETGHNRPYEITPVGTQMTCLLRSIRHDCSDREGRAQMPRKRHTQEQIIGKLREAKIELAKGQTTLDVVRKLGITEQTYYRWRKEYG